MLTVWICLLLYLLFVTGWIILGLKSKNFYAIVKFLALHSKSINGFLFHLTLKGENNKAVRVLALVGTGIVFALIVPGLFMLGALAIEIINHINSKQTSNKVSPTALVEENVYGEKINKKIHEPRYGKLEIEQLEDGSIYNEVRIKINGKTIYDYKKQNDENMVGVEIESMYNLEDEDVYIVGNSSGGTACPRLYKIISIKPNASPYISDSFGTCSDLFGNFIKNFTDHSIEIIMPNIEGGEKSFLYKNNTVIEK